MMFTIKMADMYAPTQGESNYNKLGSMTSDLIVIIPGSRSISFAVTYVILPLLDGVHYKIHCVQLGLTGPKGEFMGKIPHQSMIDVIIPRVNEGSTLQNIISFLQKLIMVECGLHYQYESHASQCGEYIDVNKWISIFSNVSRLVPVHVHQLDATLERRRQLMKMTEHLIENKAAVPERAQGDTRSPDQPSSAGVAAFHSESTTFPSKFEIRDHGGRGARLNSEPDPLFQTYDKKNHEKTLPSDANARNGFHVSHSANIVKSHPVPPA